MTITITVIYTPRPPFRRRHRWQPWRWTAVAANGRTMATSAESYTNHADAITAIWSLFGSQSSAVLRDTDGQAFILRSGSGE